MNLEIPSMDGDNTSSGLGSPHPEVEDRDMDISRGIFYRNIHGGYTSKETEKMQFYTGEDYQKKGNDGENYQVVNPECCCKQSVSVYVDKELPKFHVVGQLADRQKQPAKNRVSPLTAIFPPSPFVRDYSMLDIIPEWPPSNPSPTSCCRPDVRADRAVYQSSPYVGVDGYIYYCAPERVRNRVPMVLQAVDE